MQISKSFYWVKFYLALLFIAIISFWLMQNSINLYWQQTYHQAPPWQSLNQFRLWRLGAEIEGKTTQFYQDSLSKLKEEAAPWEAARAEILNKYEANAMPSEEIDVSQDEFTSENSEPFLQISIADMAAAMTKPLKTVAEEQVKNELPLENTVEVTQTAKQQKGKLPIILKKGNKVLLAGDSMMQGLAPQIQKHLQQKYGISSINLSKQSTGLSYPSFFDWPKTIEESFSKNKDISLLMVFLGPNDPWDFPNPNKKSEFLKFKSKEWEEEYQNRVQSIIEIAHKANAEVIWIGVPYMRAKKYDEKMRFINQVIENATKDKAHFIPIREYLSGGKDVYVDSLSINGKMTRIRGKDGIHFTTGGLIYLNELIKPLIQYSE